MSEQKTTVSDIRSAVLDRDYCILSIQVVWETENAHRSDADG